MIFCLSITCPRAPYIRYACKHLCMHTYSNYQIWCGILSLIIWSIGSHSHLWRRAKHLEEALPAGGAIISTLSEERDLGWRPRQEEGPAGDGAAGHTCRVEEQGIAARGAESAGFLLRGGESGHQKDKEDQGEEEQRSIRCVCVSVLGHVALLFQR